MNPRAQKRSRLALGLMSGTSCDGIDVALVDVGDGSPAAKAGKLRARLRDFQTLPFPAAVRAEVLRVAEGAPLTSGEFSQLNVRLGQVFGGALLDACRKFRVSPARIGVIGSHGQTIYHQGAPSAYLGADVASTLQIGDPAIIAGLTGITTVGDFRLADMAVGGQGAPLVPWVDYLLYRDARRGRVALNIGGIANITVIPRAAKPEDVFAFDTGPGNMIMDALVQHFTRGKHQFDRDARLASRGRLLPELLDTLLAEPYFLRTPPKTAGREQYGRAFVTHMFDAGRKMRARPEDLLRTAAMLTALSIVAALHRFVPRSAGVSELIISGGGARNPLIVAQLAASLPGIAIVPSDRLGLPGDAKEAFAFALLANETMHGRPANLPGATGANRAAILGKICYAPPR